MATINGRYVTIEKEDLGFDVDITQQPVEREIDVSDHVQCKARTLSLSGLVTGDQAAEIHRYLIETNDKGKIVQYTGRSTFRGLMSGFSSSRDYNIANGFTFSMTLTEVHFGNASYVVNLPTPVKVQAAPVVNSGVKQTKENKNNPASTPKKTSTSAAKGK
ncbi:hypothetical protein J2Z69_003653 [Paenibacillus shirakamiensis]|uniref:Dit-like phage tail protein N-terminal domain-containing protein n=1 Tax=Paenibacillus shirakamiensis TaxID=1265935 RepID=A0ABS4JLI5_9BACL|nr:hypothetical protein [Paenibacillus shirakamiensis]MBP2002567.1 hypothetical protein [Paenibacillus shirakamiensis]